MSDLLEPIEMEEVPSKTPRQWPRWLWAVPAGLGAAFFAGVPLRLTVARSEVVRLEAQWRMVQAVDAGRVATHALLVDNASPADRDRVAVAGRAADQEAGADLQRLSDTAGRDVVVDPAVRRLRQAIVDAAQFDAQEAALGTIGGFDRAVRIRSARDGAHRADALLADQLRRFSLRPIPDLAPRHLAAADSVLTTLGHIVDQPWHGRLIGASPSGLVVVDLGHNTVTPARVGGLPPRPIVGLVPRRGWVAVVESVSQGVQQLYAVPASLTGEARLLTPVAFGPAVFAAARLDALWIQLPDRTVEEIDGAGTKLFGPAMLAGSSRLLGAVHDGLVVSTNRGRSRANLTNRHPTLTIWDPRRSQVVRTIGPSAIFIAAAAHNTVAWVAQGGALRFTTVSSGTTVTATLPRGEVPGSGAGALSPDGRYFATSLIGTQDQRAMPAVVDVETGAVRLPTRPPGELPVIGGWGWSPAGDRIYFTTGTDTLVWPMAREDLAYLRLRRQSGMAVVPQ